MKKTYKLGVIGHPISHSKSPLIHNQWLKDHQLLGTYEPIDIAPQHLQRDLQEMIAQGFDGFNATIPHKEALLDLCDEIDDTARKIGAINTVKIVDGKMIGTNTDAYGFIHNITSKTAYDFSSGSALILGAGGATRAALYGLIQEGTPKIYLTNRTKERAEVLKNNFCHPEMLALKDLDSSAQALQNDRIRVIDWDKKEGVLPEIGLLTNTTSLGMDGADPLEINLQNLKENAIVNDIVYAPLITPLLQDAQTQGNQTITGIGMLLHQAALAFEFWTGIMPAVTQELENEVLS